MKKGVGYFLASRSLNSLFLFGAHQSHHQAAEIKVNFHHFQPSLKLSVFGKGTVRANDGINPELLGRKTSAEVRSPVPDPAVEPFEESNTVRTIDLWSHREISAPILGSLSND